MQENQSIIPKGDIPEDRFGGVQHQETLNKAIRRMIFPAPDFHNKARGVWCDSMSFSIERYDKTGNFRVWQTDRLNICPQK